MRCLWGFLRYWVPLTCTTGRDGMYATRRRHKCTSHVCRSRSPYLCVRCLGLCWSTTYTRVSMQNRCVALRRHPGRTRHASCATSVVCDPTHVQNDRYVTSVMHRYITTVTQRTALAWGACLLPISIHPIPPQKPHPYSVLGKYLARIRPPYIVDATADRHHFSNATERQLTRVPDLLA